MSVMMRLAVMRKHDLHLDRRQSWCVSTDPEFSRKRAIVGLYLNPPEKPVLSVMRSPYSSSGAGSRLHPVAQRASVSGFAHEYESHGTTRSSRL